MMPNKTIMTGIKNTKKKLLINKVCLKDNDEIAKALIEEAFMQDEKLIRDNGLKSNLVDIVLKHY